MKHYYNFRLQDVYAKLNTSEKGLTSQEASARLQRNGKNVLEEGKSKTWLQRFFAQMKDLMIIVLLCASLISAVIAIVEGKYVDLIDAGIILLIVVLNAVIGTIQESKADQAMKELTKMNRPFAKVLRDGEVTKIKCEDIVVGDIVVLEAGDVVPADLRLISTKSLKIQEATLTGESVPSEKDCTLELPDETALGDRKTMAYSTGVVTYGRGSGVVVATGMNTEVGKIAGMLNTQEKNDTPLQVQLAKTAKVLSFVVLGIALIIFVAGIFNKTADESILDSIVESFMTAVAIAVAAIPEGLPAVVTIVLAIGVKKMSERKAIVKNLPAVETLGCCEVICSDKTGTLTLNKMTVKQFYTKSMGLFYREEKSVDFSVNKLLEGMVLCNDTEERLDNELIGDPTETALVAYAKKIKINVKELKANHTRIDEVPFDSKRKLMTTVHFDNIDNKKIAYTKGAFDMLLQKCTKILVLDKERDITPEDIAELKKANKEMGSNALRVLGLAYKKTHLSDHDNLESDLVFVGLVGMIDPPRKEVAGAVATCAKAGMSAVMITGDHLDTAVAIATQIGIYKKGDKAITGAELDKLTDEEFLRDLRKYKVYARVSPENKVRIVNAYKSFNVIVAMTGDGVNDAPSIKTADIGIGMGITGTDVSKGAADIVLADDNFATIIAAVEEGRKVYSNIKKAVQYLLSANIAEVLCLFIATIFMKVEFLSAVMILWVNLVTDSFPALALGVEKVEKDIMNRPPRKAGQSLFAGHTGRNIILQGLFQTILTMASFCIGGYALGSAFRPEVAMTMAFVTLSLIQLLHSYNSRSQTHSLFSSNPFSNKMINYAFLAGLALTAMTFIPAFQTFMGTTMLSGAEFGIAIGCAFAIIPLVEIQKFVEWLLRKKKNKTIENFKKEENTKLEEQN